MSRWKSIVSFAVLSLIVLLGSPPAGRADGWPERPLSMMVGFPAGGSADVLARVMAPYLADALKGPVIVINKPGANSQLAINELIADKSGYSILFSSLSPFIASTIIDQKAAYKLSDLAFINGQWTDWDILFVRNDSKYQTLAGLISDARASPGTLSVAVVQGSPSYLSTLLLLQAANLGNAVTVVPYRGGNDARLAVVGGHVQFTLVPAQETVSLKDKIKPLAVLREDRSPDWDAPTIAEALQPLGLAIPLIKGTTRGMAVSADFRSRYPDRYDRLVQTYQAILARGEVQANLRRLGLGGDWLGPERTTAAIEDGYRTLEKYQGLMNSK